MNRRDGQSLIETCLAVGLICFIFMGLLQIALLFSAREVLYHAAARGARAKTVGFNRWMVRKVVRAAAIPNAGKMLTPDFENVDDQLRDMVQTQRPGELWDSALQAQPQSSQYALEEPRIPFYLGADNVPHAEALLDYEDWDTIHITDGLYPPVQGEDDDVPVPLHFRVRQRYPLWVPMHRSFYDADSVSIAGESYLENHYPLYIDDRLW